MKLLRKLVYLLIMLCFTTALAQASTPSATTCDAMVQQALANVQDKCATTARNQACYGYLSLDATPRDGAQGFSFAKVGDIVNVADIDTLHLSALDEANDTWGIALMKLQANLPDTLPGQNVTMLMFGDVQIQNAAGGGATVQVTSVSGINIRLTPSTTGQLIGSISKGTVITADGRTDDSSWLRVHIPSSNIVGWVFASLFTPASDISALSVVDSLDEASGTPMQAFYFKTGVTQTGCASAPSNGILIQSPKGQGRINMRANDVSIEIGSTAFLQAQPSGSMTVSVLEGDVQITADGKSVSIPAGSQASVPIDANLKASSAPDDPQPYDSAQVAPLPVQELPEAITIAPPASAADIQAANPEPTVTPAPTVSSGDTSAQGDIPGIFGDIAGLTDLSVGQFCATMNTVFTQSGLSREQYLAVINQYAGQLPAQTQAQMTHFEQMISDCP